MQTPEALRAYASRCEANAAALEAQYSGVRPSWVSGDIGRLWADARAARMLADQIEGGAQ